MTDKEWQGLEQRYQEVFGTNIPRTKLPANQETAGALVRIAVALRDDSLCTKDVFGVFAPYGRGRIF